jgi:signal transduction histidine kinase
VRTAARADGIASDAGARITPILHDAQRTALSGIRVLDYRGIVVAGRADVGLSFAHLEEVTKALSGRYASSIRERTLNQPPPALASISRGTGIRVFVSVPIFREDRLIGVVLLSRTPRSILQHLYRERETVFLIGTAMLLLALALAVFTSYTLARPLHALIDQTGRFAKGDKKALAPLQSPVTEEVALLSRSFSEMAQALEHRSEYIRNFAMHVSHEFKTPLAAIQGAIELLREHLDEMPAEKRDRFLGNIAQDAERLKRLMDRLLEMARADVLEPAAGETPITPMIERLRERYKDQGLRVSLRAEQDLAAAVTPEILEAVFSNLIDNSRQNGADKVEISAAHSSGRLSLTIADNGNGISPANSDKIFMPFFTTRRDDGGTGLGLGIVKSLLRAYGGDISLGSSDKGTVFFLSLPTKR